MAGNIWKGLVLGTGGSVAGLLAMQAYWQQVAPQLTAALGDSSESDGEEEASSTRWGSDPIEARAPLGRQYQQGESSTDTLGRIFYKVLTGAAPEDDALKRTLSELVHWGYGMSQGAMYGAMRGGQSGLDLGYGAFFGTRLWLLGDEMMVPFLGLQPGPTRGPVSQHLNRLGAHVAFGVATAAATQLLRKLF